MKKLTKLTLLALLMIFASCQNESVQGDGPEQPLLRFKDGDIVSDGLLDEELIFDENSEVLRTKKQSFSVKTVIDCTPDLLDTGYSENVNIEVINKPGDNGYFDISIDGGDVIQAYCSDRLPSLGADDDFLDFAVISTYDSAVSDGGIYADVFTNNEEFDKVNWIINNIDISEGSEYTYGHVQYAIWRLIEGPFQNDFTVFLTPDPATVPWTAADNAKGEAIFALAEANGDGYEPACGDKLGLLLIPNDPDNVQSLLICKEIPEVEDCEYTEVSDGECSGCDASMSVSFSCDCQCVEVSACKDLSNIVLLTADGSEVKYEDLDGQTASLCSPDGSPIVSVWVKAGCYQSGDGPGYGRRFDNPNPECAPEEECQDCTGKVTDLTLNWDWHNSHRVRAYQRIGNTWHAAKIFDQVVEPNENFDLSGVNQNGTFGKWVYIFVDHCYYTKIKTNCHINIGPGYRRGVVEVVSGESSLGGELCEYVPPHHWCWWW